MNTGSGKRAELFGAGAQRGNSPGSPRGWPVSLVSLQGVCCARSTGGSNHCLHPHLGCWEEPLSGQKDQDVKTAEDSKECVLMEKQKGRGIV